MGSGDLPLFLGLLFLLCSQGLFVNVLLIIKTTLVANIDGTLAMLGLLSVLYCLNALTLHPSLFMLVADDPTFPFLVS